MIQPIVVELLSGVDCSLLTSKEMQSVPFDYIRQVCLLPAMTEAEQSEYGEEAIVSMVPGGKMAKVNSKQGQFKDF